MPKEKKQPIENKSVVYIIKAAFPADPEEARDVNEVLDRAVDNLRELGYARVVDMQMVEKPFDDAVDEEFDKDAEFLVKGKQALVECKSRLAQARQALLDAADIINPALIDTKE